MGSVATFEHSEQVVRTTVEWLGLLIDSIGALVIAIAVIRTALNYFLMVEMRSETRREDAPREAPATPGVASPP